MALKFTPHFPRMKGAGTPVPMYTNARRLSPQPYPRVEYMFGANSGNVNAVMLAKHLARPRPRPRSQRGVLEIRLHNVTPASTGCRLRCHRRKWPQVYKSAIGFDTTIAPAVDLT